MNRIVQKSHPNMQDLKDDILNRANQIVSLCQNADTSADQTIIRLADQHEQLVNIETNLVTIDTTLIDTKQNINRLKGITQRFIGTFRTKFHRKIISKILINSRKTENNSLLLQRRKKQVSHAPIQPNACSSNSVIDGQIDNALYQIDHLIHSLKDKAYTINDQLIGQADVLDHIHERMIESTVHIDQQNLDMKKINPKN